MIAHKLPKKLKAALAGQRPLSPQTEQREAKKPGKPLPVHERSLLPETHMAEPLDLDDVLADRLAR